jgi:hypothetical protein
MAFLVHTCVVSVHRYGDPDRIHDAIVNIKFGYNSAIKHNTAKKVGL